MLLLVFYTALSSLKNQKTHSTTKSNKQKNKNNKFNLISYKFKKQEPIMSSKKLVQNIPKEKIQCIVKSKKSQNTFWVANSSGNIFKLTVNSDNVSVLSNDKSNAPTSVGYASVN